MKQNVEIGPNYIHVSQTSEPGDDEMSRGVLFSRTYPGMVTVAMTDGNEGILLEEETWNKVVAKMQEQKCAI